jgi:hypothetical protein
LKLFSGFSPGANAVPGTLDVDRDDAGKFAVLRERTPERSTRG